MLYIGSISVFQFKNYLNSQFTFPKKVIAICGRNGVGKTNLLDAIHYLCFTKSYFSRTDAMNVSHGTNGFRIEGNIELNDEKEKVVCVLRENGKKEFSVNNNTYERFSAHIGRYPLVFIAPDDAELITGGSELRRKFLDSLLSQLDHEYLEKLIAYQKILVQRNALLKSLAETRSQNNDLLDVLDQQLKAPCEFIFTRRKEFLVGFLPMVKHLYQEISQQQEDISIIYESQFLEASFDELITGCRKKDLQLARSSTGIHRDELELLLTNQPFRNIASQGQRKSLLFALKLAEMEVLAKEKKFAPVLLLDDVFEKLDEDRISNLLEKVCVKNSGQVFITDTNEERLTAHLDNHGVDYHLLSLG